MGITKFHKYYYLRLARVGFENESPFVDSSLPTFKHINTICAERWGFIGYNKTEI